MSRGARTVLVVGLCALGTLSLLAHKARRVTPTLPTPPAAFLDAREPLAQLEPAVGPAGARRPAPELGSRVALASALHSSAPGAAEHDEAPAHAHPLTPQHQALRAQQQLVAALNDALDLRDAQAMRGLIERYDTLAPEDPLRLAEGYERVADCIEALEPARRASARENAQRYYEDARASPLRRYVRRLCLEPAADAP